MRKREFATCVAIGNGVISRSVSDPSQILHNSKKRFANSLILDKNKKIEKIAQIGNYCQLKSNLLLVFINSVYSVDFVVKKSWYYEMEKRRYSM